MAPNPRDAASEPVATGLHLSDDAVLDVLERHYGLSVTALSPLNSEQATVRRVDTDLGRFCFKAVAATADGVEALRWQGGAIAVLADAGLPAPRLLDARDGRSTVVVAVDGAAVAIQVGDWLEGMPLARSTPDEDLLVGLGGIAASMSTALADYPPPPVAIDHVWELRNTGRTLSALLPDLDDPAIVRSVTAAVRVFDEVVAPRLAGLPSGIVHHDLNDFNVLIDPHRPASPERWPVTAILDFGDMVAAPRVAELSTLAAYAARLSDDPVEAVVAVARGWSAILPLSIEEAAVVRAGAIARLAVNLAVWRVRLSTDRAEYASERIGASASALAVLLDSSERETTRRILEVQGRRSGA